MNQMKEIFSAAVIQRRVEEMAAQIDAVYGEDSVVAVCVLKGAFPFFSDLVRAMKSDVLIDFVRLASYGDRASSSEHVQITKDVEISLEAVTCSLSRISWTPVAPWTFLCGIFPRGERSPYACRSRGQEGTPGIRRAFRLRGF